MINKDDWVRVLQSNNPYHEVGDIERVREVHPTKGIKLTDNCGGAVWYKHEDLSALSDWVELHKEEAKGYGQCTSALALAGGCLVRTFEWGDFNTESSVFVPNSNIVNRQVVQRPTRLQISESQSILVSEVAAVSKRPKELVFTLKCGKEIITTENIDSVLVAFMQAAP